MLAQERFEKILELLRTEQSVTVAELTKKLNISESTIRRDLTTLHKQGLLIKVHGGATAVKSILSREEAVAQKSGKQLREKREIARYAAGCISAEDFVYIDAGTTTELVIDYLTEKGAVYVTNGISHARKLMNSGYRVFLLGGEVKAVTEAIIGEDALDNLEKYNFSIGFFGVNGIDIERGFTTPDPKEAAVKKKALRDSNRAIVLADKSKFNQISSVKFADIQEAEIITEQLDDIRYRTLTTIKEVFS